MVEVIFSPSLTDKDRSVVSQKAIDAIILAAEESNNPLITITSTLRPPARQAKAMYDNLQAGKRISYAAPGREVVAVYDRLRPQGYSPGTIINRMTERIEELAAEGKMVSRHCVTEAQYAKENIIDISTRLPNPRDFVKAIIQNPRITKVITPFVSDYNRSFVHIDSNEPAIHLQIICGVARSRNLL